MKKIGKEPRRFFRPSGIFNAALLGFSIAGLSCAPIIIQYNSQTPNSKRVIVPGACYPLRGIEQRCASNVVINGNDENHAVIICQSNVYSDNSQVEGSIKQSCEFSIKGDGGGITIEQQNIIELLDSYHPFNMREFANQENNLGETDTCPRCKPKPNLQGILQPNFQRASRTAEDFIGKKSTRGYNSK